MEESDAFSDFSRRAKGGIGMWQDEDEEEWRSEVGESYYLDMLRDVSRNQSYRDGLRRGILQMKQLKSDSVAVLDIGTGSGLLAMMAKQEGASTVTACECFEPVARSAKKCLAANKLEDEITLIAEASTKITAECMRDGRKVDIIVNELYDTELLGEGVLPTLRHALRSLSEPECMVIPSHADIICFPMETVKLAPGYYPNSIYSSGGNQVFPLEEDQKVTDPVVCTMIAESMFVDKLLLKGGGRILGDPKLCFSINFAKVNEQGIHQGEWIDVSVQDSGTLHAITYWWDLRMCPDDKNPDATNPLSQRVNDRPSQGVLSMAPGAGWRDHWRQNVCMLERPLVVAKGDTIVLRAVHDDWRIWFDVYVKSSAVLPDAVQRFKSNQPATNPDSARVSYGGHKLRMLANTDLEILYRQALMKHVKTDTIALCIGDGHFLGLIASELGCRHVMDLEVSENSLLMATSCFKAAGFDDKASTLLLPQYFDSPDEACQVLEAELSRRQLTVNLICADPFFFESGVGAFAGGGGTQFNNLAYWKTARAIKEKVLQGDVAMLPCAAYIRGVAVEFAHLRNSQQRVKMVENLDLESFCDIQPLGCKASAGVAYDVWMYDWRPLTPEFSLLSIDFASELKDQVEFESFMVGEPQTCAPKATLSFTASGTCHAIVLWIDWKLAEGISLSWGPKDDTVDHCKQVVYFLDEGIAVDSNSCLHADVAYFDSTSCEFFGSFRVSSSAEGQQLEISESNSKLPE